MAASVAVDSFPNRRFDGWVGFISPVAEFTPKSVQTEELRTSLVYEVRVFVKDPSDELRLGMPATVYLNTDKETKRLRQGQRDHKDHGAFLSLVCQRKIPHYVRDDKVFVISKRSEKSSPKD